MTSREIEKINRSRRNFKDETPAQFARHMGYPYSTIKEVLDENWYPGKYYTETEVDYDKYLGSGLYFLIQQVIYDNEVLNLIKVGKSKDLQQRIKSYKGMNPFARCIDIFQCEPDRITALEQEYHKLLGEKNKRFENTEWFICNDEQYQYWINQTFDLHRPKIVEDKGLKKILKHKKVLKRRVA